MKGGIERERSRGWNGGIERRKEEEEVGRGRGEGMSGEGSRQREIEKIYTEKQEKYK